MISEIRAYQILFLWAVWRKIKKTKKISKNVLTIKNGNDILRYVAEEKRKTQQQSTLTNKQ